MSNSVYFLIQRGRPLEMVKQYIADSIANEDRVKALVVELGCERFVMHKETQALLGVKFPRGATVPDGFKKVDSKGISYPKIGSAWAKRFAEETRVRSASALIASEFKIPLSISYKSPDGGEGSRRVGGIFNACGFLWLSPEGPFAMWIPDVEGEVQSELKRNHTVDEPEQSFRAQIKGCRRIEIEEWEIMVSKDELAKKRAAASQNHTEEAAVPA